MSRNLYFKNLASFERAYLMEMLIEFHKKYLNI